MNISSRLLVLALGAILASPLVGCAGRQGSSFETLGVPEPEDRPGMSPLILGWARESRDGWIIDGVRIDNRARREWNEETQRPTIFYLAPGSYEMRVSSAQLRDPRDRNSHPRRRYRIRPFTVDLETDTAQVCVIRIEGGDRRRPQVQCESREFGAPEDDEGEMAQDEYGDEYADEDEIAGEPETPAAAAEPPSAAGSAVPSPFDTPAGPPPREQPAADAQPEAAPTPASAQPTPAPAASPSGASPRPMSVEERIERLERQVEELRRQLRPR